MLQFAFSRAWLDIVALLLGWKSTTLVVLLPAACMCTVDHALLLRAEV